MLIARYYMYIVLLQHTHLQAVEDSRVRGRSPTRIVTISSRETAVTATPLTAAAAPVVLTTTAPATVTPATATVTVASIDNDSSNSGSSSDSEHSSSSSDDVLDRSGRNRALLQRKSLQDRLQKVGATAIIKDPPEIEVRTCSIAL
jgi:hypothetical protein